MHYLIANTIAFFVSVLNSYFWNNRYVFTDRKDSQLHALCKMYLAYGLTFSLGTLLLYIMVSIMDISDLIAPIINLFLTIPLNFILNKFWAMK